MWCKYSNISGSSGIDSYRILPNKKVIQIRFTKKSNIMYSYNASKIGEKNFNQMVSYANKGKNLKYFY